MALNALAFVKDLIRKFDPAQPRDPKGRWTKGAGGSPYEKGLKKAKETIVTGNVSVPEDLKAEFIAYDGMKKINKYVSKILETTGLPKIGDIIIVKGWGGRYSSWGAGETQNCIMDIGINWLAKNKSDVLKSRLTALNEVLREHLSNARKWLSRYNMTRDPQAKENARISANGAAQAGRVLGRWAYQKKNKGVHTHSMFAFRTLAEALITHELGHHFHANREKEIDKAFNFPKVTKDPKSIKLRKKLESELAQQIGQTARARDSWQECVAENFALYWAGHKKGMDERFVKLFDATASKVKKIDPELFCDDVWCATVNVYL